MIECDGVPFVVDGRLYGWLKQGESVDIDYNERWGNFRVGLAGVAAC